MNNIISVVDTETILTELCNRVGVQRKTVNTAQSHWFWKHTWTEEEEEQFRIWLGKFLEEKKYCRGKYRGQNRGYYEAGKVVMDIGWKTQDK